MGLCKAMVGDLVSSLSPVLPRLGGFDESGPGPGPGVALDLPPFISVFVDCRKRNCCIYFLF